jgi:hypothetical protein
MFTLDSEHSVQNPLKKIRVRRINVWDHGSLERLGQIFDNHFNHDYRENYDSPSEHPKIFMLEVLKIQVGQNSLSDLEFSAKSHF